MNLLDYALMAIVALSVILAAMQGFVYEIWMMAATGAAIGVAAWRYRAVAPWFDWLGAAEARNFAAFVAVLAGVMVAAMVVGRLARRLLRAAGLGGLDRLLGAGVGLARGLALGAAVVFMLTAYPLSPRLLRDSRLAPEFLWGSRALAWVMPRPLAARFEAHLGRMRTGVVEMGKEL